MARRPTRLKRRIAGVGQDHAGSQAALAGVVPATPMEMPMALVTYTPVQRFPWGHSAQLQYEDLHPLITADGAVIPARDNGGWGWVKPAGRP
jgi:hypothetical protein